MTLLRNGCIAALLITIADPAVSFQSYTSVRNKDASYVNRVTSNVYLIFYDYDKPVITPEGNPIVQLAAQAVLSGVAQKIKVFGYTDTSISPAYSVEFSTITADKVRDALIRRGIPEEVIEVQGRGDKFPRVPTGPGVREPQNRRVEVIIE
jgi:OmpA-OmpF porin, OOP family